MSWKVLRPQIVELIRTVDTLVEVSPTPKLQFSGYPAAHVVPSDNLADYETSSENERQYAWFVRAIYETKSTGIEQAYTGLEEVVDSLIDLFDMEDMKKLNRVVGIDLPENYTFLNIFATPSRWTEISELGLLVAEVIIKIRISVDVS